jgi:hypothetical protein
MSELDDLLNDIEKLKYTLNKLIEQNQGDLQDPEIMSISEIINAAIVKYTELLNNK